MQAYTGFLLLAFVFIHLLGIIYAKISPVGFEIYALTLHSNILLPYIEIALTLTFLVHIYLTITKSIKSVSAGNTANLKSKSLDYVGKISSKLQPFTGLVLILFLFVHIRQLRFIRPIEGMELQFLKDSLHSKYSYFLYSLASISLSFHLIKGIESAHRSSGILSSGNSSKIRFFGRFISLIFGCSYLLMTNLLR